MGVGYFSGRRSARASVVAAALLASAASGAAANSQTVASLLGTWGGSGRISYNDGTSEAIRCTAYNTGGGTELQMAIQCRSDKNPIHIRSKLTFDGSKASGTWEERTFNASGSATGTASTSTMTLGINGGGFDGSMQVSFGKSSQTINITARGISMTRATMNLNKQ